MYVDVGLVRKRYAEAGYHGIASFVDFVLQKYAIGEEVLEVVCSRVCFAVPPQELTTLQRAELPDYHIGSREYGILPLEALAALDLSRTAHDELVCLDLVCKDVAHPTGAPVALAVTVGIQKVARQ